jgi:hypothetical protein
MDLIEVSARGTPPLAWRRLAPRTPAEADDSAGCDWRVVAELFLNATGVLIVLPAWGGDGYGFPSRPVVYQATGTLEGEGPWACGRNEFRIIEDDDPGRDGKLFKEWHRYSIFKSGYGKTQTRTKCARSMRRAGYL